MSDSGSLPCCLIAVHWGFFFAALGVAHGNSRCLPPAVQSALLQWTPFLWAAEFMVLLDKTEGPRPHFVASLWPPLARFFWCKESGGFFLFFSSPLFVPTELNAASAWRQRSPWDPGWWWSRWPEACWSASASGTWAAAAAGPGPWTVPIRSAAQRKGSLAYRR